MVSIAANWKCMRCMNCFFMHADNEVALSYSLLLECIKLICFSSAYRRDWFASFIGALAVLFRQTNIVWVFFMAIQGL